MGGAWLLERSVHIDDVENFLFKAVIRKRLCRVESKRARFAHDHIFPYPERRPLDAVTSVAGRRDLSPHSTQKAPFARGFLLEYILVEARGVEPGSYDVKHVFI